MGTNILREELQPTYKLQNGGKGHLSDVDIVASLIGSGKTKKNQESAQRIIDSCNGIQNIKKLSYSEIASVGNITEAAAMRLTIAVEFGSRSDSREKDANITEIRGSRDGYNLLYQNFAALLVEESWLLTLNKKNKVIKKEMLSRGGTDATIMDAKVVFRKVIANGGACFIVAHNHPSGTLRPSQADIDMTRKLKSAGEVIGLPLIDHLIVTDAGYFSFLDEGFI